MLLEVATVSEDVPVADAGGDDGEEEAGGVGLEDIDWVEEAGGAIVDGTEIDEPSVSEDVGGEEAVVGGVAVRPVVAVPPDGEGPTSVVGDMDGVATTEVVVDMGG